MKKNMFFVAALLMLASGPVFLTSCQKDYDGELEIIRNQIKNGNINLDGLKEKITLIEKQIEELNKKIDAGDATHAEDFKALKAELEKVRLDLKNQVAELQKQIDSNKEDLVNIKAQIEQVQQNFDLRLSAISDKLNKIDASVNVLDGRITKLENQMTSLQQKQEAVEKAITGLRGEIDGLGADMTEQKKKLENALQTLQTLDSRLTQEIAKMQQQVDAVKEATEQNAQNLEELRQKTAEQISNLKNDIDKQIASLTTQMAGLSETLTALNTKVEELNNKYDQIDSRLSKLEADYNLQIQKIWEKINSLDSAGQDPDIAKLKEVVETLQKDYMSFKDSLKNVLTKVLNTQALYGTRLQNVEQLVADHTTRLNNLENKLKDLNVLVSKLETTITEMNTAYQETFDKINARLEALEQQGCEDPEILKQMQKDLQDLQNKVNAQAQEMLKIKNDQDAQAQKLAALHSMVVESVTALQMNYAQLNTKVDALNNFVLELNDNVRKINASLFALTEEVTKNTADIADLKQRIDQLEQNHSNYITREEVQSLLSRYYDKDAIDSKFADVLKKIETLPTKDDVNKLIENAIKSLKPELEAMNNKIEQLNEKYTNLDEKVNQLMKRIQSFELIADYNDGMIKAEKTGANKYQVKLTVEVTPDDVLISELLSVKGTLSLRQRNVSITTRANTPQMKDLHITDVSQTHRNELAVTAEFSMERDYKKSQELPYQIALVFNDGNNYKLSEYRSLRLIVGQAIDTDKEYLFKTEKEELIKTHEGTGLNSFKEDEIYPLRCLTDQTITDYTVCQIAGEPDFFKGKVLGYPKEMKEEGKGVTYSLAAIYDSEGKPRMDLFNYIRVDYTGKIKMASPLNPTLTGETLEGFRVVIGLQAYQGGYEYGKPGYACFRLEKVSNN